MAFAILATRFDNAIQFAQRISDAKPEAGMHVSRIGSSGDFHIYTSPEQIRGRDFDRYPIVFSLFCGDISGTSGLERAALVYGRAQPSAILRVDDTPMRENWSPASQGEN